MREDAWDPGLYEKFAEERAQPFFDLLALVRPIPGGRAVDLGCGTGELTRALHERVGAAETVGLDSSASMLAKAGPFAGAGLRFERGNIHDYEAPRPCDLVFSNAALQWVPDHRALLARLTGFLGAGGQLAFQVPANFDHATHAAAEETAALPEFAGPLGGAPHPRNVLPPEDYAAALDRLGFSEQTVRLQVYGHRLQSREELVEWVRGSLLTDYEKRLPEEIFPRFLASYRERLFDRVPDERPLLFPFKRILAWAARPAETPGVSGGRGRRETG